jgi:beta-lactamase regulating signal transducer with metallopeptidase domain
MNADALIAALVSVNLVGSAAILLVLALRPLVLRRLGATAAYRLWLVVPIAAAACLLPAREVPPPAQPFSYTPFGETEPVVVGGAADAPAAAARADAALSAAPRDDRPMTALLLAWLLGAGALLARSIAITLRLSVDPAVGPALIGVLRPRLVLPDDFETRFDARERALILAHEEVHRVSGHTLVNGLVELARCACWFNPLAHLASLSVRTDQELACDAAVLAIRPDERRAYAQALLKTQVAPAYLPLGCTWPSRTSRRLEERITMMARPSPGFRTRLAGAAVVAVLAASSGVAAWSQQPARVGRPEPVWTPSADAPEGLLTPIEVMRHDLFIELARNAASCPGSPREACRDGEGVDIVLFGTTNAEMFWWPDRGMRVWRETLGLRKAVNFGSQGTRTESLVWRMRNGELDGYEAKLIVLAAFCCIEAAVAPERRAALVASYEPILAEIRARQPQAKILILADFPRGMLSREAWRRAAATNAEAHAPLIDDETVFWLDIGERFYRPDGSHDQTMWSLDMRSRGIQGPAFAAFAEELEPWFERFVD